MVWTFTHRLFPSKFPKRPPHPGLPLGLFVSSLFLLAPLFLDWSPASFLSARPQLVLLGTPFLLLLGSAVVRCRRVELAASHTPWAADLDDDHTAMWSSAAVAALPKPPPHDKGTRGRRGRTPRSHNAPSQRPSPTPSTFPAGCVGLHVGRGLPRRMNNGAPAPPTSQTASSSPGSTSAHRRRLLLLLLPLSTQLLAAATGPPIVSNDAT